MREIQRTIYLDWLWSGRDRTDVVKIITGMRRSGKTVLMRQFMQRLIDSGVPEGNIVYMNFESRDWQDITDHDLLLDEISSRGIPGTGRRGSGSISAQAPSRSSIRTVMSSSSRICSWACLTRS